METLFQITQLQFRYPTGKRNALQDINLEIGSGEFIVLCGNSGCGKSTLLRQFKTAVTPHGDRTGSILFHGRSLDTVDSREQAGRIGFVSQNPEDAIVTDKVWHELAFGLESLGMDNRIIRKRVAEMSHFFGIEEWFHRDISSLSGGQKQILNLAAVMVMQPEILLLDEPTSQLDPIAAVDFLAVLSRIQRELGTTIFLSEHRLEEVLPYCSRLLVMERGSIILDGRPGEVAEELRVQGNSLFRAMPSPMRIWNAVERNGAVCPMTVQEGREWFSHFLESHTLFSIPEEKIIESEQQRKCTLEVTDIWFRYDKKAQDILQGFSLCAYSGETLAILGGNGSGKTTMLSLISGRYKPQQGRISSPSGEEKRVITLPQNPQLLFVEDTVRRELEAMQKPGGRGAQSHEEQQKRISQMIELCKLETVLEQHPYDLSGGEQQRLGLAKVLLARPDILLLDEPTKGISIEYKEEFAVILKKLKESGVTIIMVSHDIEFCAEQADRCILVFDGQVAAEGTPRQLFSENHFYTTNANRMVRTRLPLAITVEDVIRACTGRGEDERKASKGGERKKEDVEEESDRWGKEQERDVGDRRTQSLPLPTLLGIFMMLIAVPFTIFFGIRFLDNQKYVFISLLVLLECMLPFFIAFEGKKPPARDVVILSVLCAIGVAGRAVFSMLPQFKPVTAVTIIAGAFFGGEAGFMVGAVTMLVSNMIFGQGPWTPWQMFAMGIIGLFAGVLFSGGKRKMQIPALCAYGFITAILIYGGIMNPATAIMGGIPMNWEVVAAYCLSGFSLDFVHGISTVLFLLLGAKPLLRKLERVRIKFG